MLRLRKERRGVLRSRERDDPVANERGPTLRDLLSGDPWHVKECTALNFVPVKRVQLHLDGPVSRRVARGPIGIGSVIQGHLYTAAVELPDSVSQPRMLPDIGRLVRQMRPIWGAP